MLAKPGIANPHVFWEKRYPESVILDSFRTSAPKVQFYKHRVSFLTSQPKGNHVGWLTQALVRVHGFHKPVRRDSRRQLGTDAS